MKKTKIVIPALGLLLLSTAASVTGTVAWFSANTQVTVAGMQVKTSVSSNLLIAEDTLASTAKIDDSLFGPGPFNSTVKGILEPVSTVNATSFYYTVNANADGSKAGGDYTLYNPSTAADDPTTYDSLFSETYGVSKTAANTLISGETGAKAYVDTVFQLKAVATEAADLKITSLDLKYGAAADGNKAYRVAIFVENITSAAPAGGVGSLNMIYAPSAAANQTAGQAVNSTSGTAAVTYNTANQKLASLAAGAEGYYKVVVRLYLEGEDTTCTNGTFATLTNSWTLSLNCKLDSTTAAVSELGMSVTA